MRFNLSKTRTSLRLAIKRKPVSAGERGRELRELSELRAKRTAGGEDLVITSCSARSCGARYVFASVKLARATANFIDLIRANAPNTPGARAAMATMLDILS